MSREGVRILLWVNRTTGGSHWMQPGALLLQPSNNSRWSVNQLALSFRGFQSGGNLTLGFGLDPNLEEENNGPECFECCQRSSFPPTVHLVLFRTEPVSCRGLQLRIPLLLYHCDCQCEHGLSFSFGRGLMQVGPEPEKLFGRAFSCLH